MFRKIKYSNMKPINPYFPKVDKNFLSQTEALILNEKTFRLNRDYPAYLNKLKSAGVKYLVVGNKSVAYFDTKPEDVRPESIIKIDDELEKLSEEFLEFAKPNIEVIRAVTGRALESQGVNIGSHASSMSFFKAERLFD